MAAPSTAYHNQKLRAGVGNPSNMLDLGTVRDMQTAKFIQNTSTDSGDGYFNAADDLATRVTKIKGIFKLDKLYPVPLGTDIGFIGMVEGDVNNAPVSANALYHNQVRFSAVPMVSGTDGKLYILLLDAGLNRKGDSSVYSVLSSDSTAYNQSPSVYPPRINNTVVWTMFKSSFYNDSTALYLQMFIADNWVDVDYLGTLLANQSYELSNSLRTDVITDSYLVFIGTHYFRASITNGEGTFYSASFSQEIRRAIATMKYDATYASYAYNGSTTKTVYYDRRVISSISGGGEVTTFCKNDVLTATSEDYSDLGYYVVGETWYKFGYYALEDIYCVTSKGLCTKWGWPTDDPLYQYYPVFSTTISGDYQELTFIPNTTGNTLELFHGDANTIPQPPEFPDATYNIVISGGVALINTDLYFYIKDDSFNYYYIGTGNTGTGATAEFSFSGDFATIGLTPLAGETYYVHITDTQI